MLDAVHPRRSRSPSKDIPINPITTLPDLGHLVTLDIETTTEVAGLPATDPQGREIRAGLDPRYGAVTDIGIVVTDLETRTHSGLVLSVTDAFAVHRNGRTEYARVDEDVAPVETAVDGPVGIAGPVNLVTCASERQLLAKLAGRMQFAPVDGIAVGWNSSVFDLPFLVDRAGKGIDLRIGLVADPAVYVKYDPLPGHAGGYRASVAGLPHLDIQAPCKALADELGVRHSLKPVAESQGIDMIEVDREKMHLLSDAERAAYVLSDAYGTAELTLRLWDRLQLGAHIDDIVGVAA